MTATVAHHEISALDSPLLESNQERRIMDAASKTPGTSWSARFSVPYVAHRQEGG